MLYFFTFLLLIPFFLTDLGANRTVFRQSLHMAAWRKKRQANRGNSGHFGLPQLERWKIFLQPFQIKFVQKRDVSYFCGQPSSDQSKFDLMRCLFMAKIFMVHFSCCIPFAIKTSLYIYIYIFVTGTDCC